ncbi:FkbM family methyltransferase [Mesorhizobium sp. KR9-304]|uniref:FkbM family methyltransferase n=1 Tax=Mesorhizobium sp. KR9-304 TaxID=3156614 RepID=UPI0032B5C10D
MSASRIAGTVAVVSLAGKPPERLPANGGFEAVQALGLTGHPPDSLSGRLGAARLAAEAEAEWMIALAPGEGLTDDAFELAAPALGLYEAIFGAAHPRGSADAVAKLSRLAFDTADRLPHALLYWWMPDAHLVRTELALHTLERVAASGGKNWKLDYLFDIWSNARCLKSAQPLLELDAEPQPLDAEATDYVLKRLADEPVFLPIVHGDATYYLPYTGRNAGIEREQSRGLFFEAMELEELRKVVKPGAHVVDVGANTGNHTVFFAGPMKAASVLPFEPLPAAADALRASVARNRLKNVDLLRLGTGVSDREGRARLVFSGRGGLGATSLQADPAGEVIVATLDSMVSGRVDLLKIDVEGMEMSVLAGSRELIRGNKPLIFIEIANRNTPALMLWLRQEKYRVLRIFTDKGHANYLLAPEAAG